MREPGILLLLGLASFCLGPLTGIPGIIIGRRMENRGFLGNVGYYSCWVITVLFVAAFVIGFFIGLSFPLWREHV